jgi:hypothetical protein
MKLYLMRGGLDEAASVNLAGIKPLHETAVDLGAGMEYRDGTTKVTLPLDKEGAYLVVAKGASIETSGLVVVSTLDLEVQEDAGAGRLRVTVHTEGKERFAADAHVKVVGSESGDFVSGDTDLRGVFEAGGLIGQATVVVKKGTSYAFFRGAQDHQPLEAARRRAAHGRSARPQTEAQFAQTADLGEMMNAQEQLDKALSGSNAVLQEQNIQKLRALTRTQQKGMQAQQAKR